MEESSNTENSEFEKTLKDIENFDSDLLTVLPPAFVDACIKFPERTSEIRKALDNKFNTINSQTDAKILNVSLNILIENQNKSLQSQNEQVKHDAEERLKYYQEFKDQLDTRLFQVPHTNRLNSSI